MARRLTHPEWLVKAIAAHGNRYDYSKTVYVGGSIRVIIICRVHGEFSQRPAHHVNRKQGCSKCAGLYCPTTDEWIVILRSVHGDRFDTSKSEYVGDKHKVTLICRKHGEFSRLPYSILKSKHGCPRCGHEASGAATRLELEGFITRARAAHGNRYDYSLTE